VGVFLEVFMRETFGMLLQTSKDLCVDDATTSYTNLSDPETFLKKEINKAVRFIISTLGNHIVEKQQTASSVADQQYYHLPPDCDRITSVTVEMGDVYYPVQIVEAQEHWDELNQIDFSGTAIPQFIFPRASDFGIWPTPQDADSTITINYIKKVKDMSATDYKDGTITIITNTTTVTGTTDEIEGATTAFTSAMVGRWLRADSDGIWYPISAYTSGTVLTLETYFEGSSVSEDTYLIGESPDIPEDLHEYIPYKAAAAYMAGYRHDPVGAQALLNYFYTGDFNNSRRDSSVAGGILGAKNTYDTKGRANSGLVRRNKKIVSRFNEVWTNTIT